MVTAMARKTPTKKSPSKGKPTQRLTPDGATFGAQFFTQVLPQMVQACPCPADQENACFVHLGDGERLDVVEILAASERFVVLAVFGDGAGRDGLTRTDDDVGFEAVPYDLVLRVSVRPAAKRGRFGFHFPHEALTAAATAAPAVAMANGAAAANGATSTGAAKKPARRHR